MEVLLKEYRQSLRDIKKARERAPQYEQKIYNGMISDLEYAVQWLSTRQRPSPKKPTIVLFKEAIYLDVFDKPNAFDPYVKNAYEVVDKKIDAERMKSKHG